MKVEELVEQDKETGDDDRTFNLLREIGDSIYPWVKFNIDVPSFYLDGSLPVLDLKLEVEDGTFEYGFFKKAFASEVVIPFTSAHSRKMKMSVVMEEGVRRLRNHSRGLEVERTRLVMEE